MPDPKPSAPRLTWWLWPQVLSLDAPLVTMAWMAAIAKSHGQHLPGVFYAALGLATWLAYLLDRTGDATSSWSVRPFSARHEFCYQHQRVILRLLVPLILAVLIWLAGFHLPQSLLVHGLPLACMCVIYLSLFSATSSSRLCVALIVAGVAAAFFMGYLQAHAPARNLMLVAALGGLGYAWPSRPAGGRPGGISWVKEIFAALLIAMGTALGAHAWTPPEHGLMCAETGLLWLLVLVNLHGIACSESVHDASPATVADTARRYYQPVLITAVLGLSLHTAQSAINPGLQALACVVTASAALLGVLHFFVRKLKPELYHWLADMALLAPLPWMWMWL